MDIIAWACVTSRDKTYFSAFCLLLNILGNFNFRQYKKHLWHFENNFVTKLAVFSCVLFDRFFVRWVVIYVFLYKNRIKKDITQSDDSLWLVTNPKGLIYKSGSDNGPIGFENLEDFNFCSLVPLKTNGRLSETPDDESFRTFDGQGLKEGVKETLGNVKKWTHRKFGNLIGSK